MSDVIAAILAAEFGNNSNNVEMRHESDPINPPSAGDVVALRGNGKIAKLPSSVVASGPSNNFFTVEDPTDSTQGWLIIPPFYGVYNEAYADNIIDLGNGLSMYPARTHLDDVALMFTNGTDQAPIQPFATGINFSTNMVSSRPFIYKLEGSTTNKFLIVGVDNTNTAAIMSHMFEVTSNSVRSIEKKVLYTGTARSGNLSVKRLTTNKLIVTMAADSSFRSLAITVNSPALTSPTTTISNTIVLRSGTGISSICMQYLTSTTMAVLVPTSSDYHTTEAFRLTLSGNTLSSASLGTQANMNFFGTSNWAKAAFHTEFINSTKFLAIISSASGQSGTAFTINVASSSFTSTNNGSLSNMLFNDEYSRVVKMSEDSSYMYFLFFSTSGGAGYASIINGARYNKSTGTTDRGSNHNPTAGSSIIAVFTRVGNRVILAQASASTNMPIPDRFVSLAVIRMNDFTYEPIVETTYTNYKSLVHYNRVSRDLQPDDTKTNRILKLLVGQVSGDIRVISQTKANTGIASGVYMNFTVSKTNLSEYLTLPSPGIPYGVLQTNGSVCLKGIAEVPTAAALKPASKLIVDDSPNMLEVGTCLSNKQILIKDYLF